MSACWIQSLEWQCSCPALIICKWSGDHWCSLGVTGPAVFPMCGRAGGQLFGVNRVEKHNGCRVGILRSHSVKHKVSCVCGRCFHSREPLSISAKQTHGPVASAAVHPQHPGPLRCASC